MDNGLTGSTLQEIKDYNLKLLRQINAEKLLTFDYLSNTFDISLGQAQKILNAAIFADMSLSGGLAFPGGFAWKNISNVSVPMTALQTVSFGQTLFSYTEAVRLNFETHETNINAFTLIADVRTYNITTGWPTFGGGYTTPTIDYKYTGSRLLRVVLFTGSFAQQSGTTNIPHDNTTPLSSEGTQIMSQAVTPRSTASKFIIRAQLPCDVSANGSHVTASVFRDTTCIGVSSVEGASKGLIGLSNSVGHSLTIVLTDSPATVSPITYSIRIGQAGGGTWFLNRTQDATYGGVGSQGWSITETE